MFHLIHFLLILYGQLKIWKAVERIHGGHVLDKDSVVCFGQTLQICSPPHPSHNQNPCFEYTIQGFVYSCNKIQGDKTDKIFMLQSIEQCSKSCGVTLHILIGIILFLVQAALMTYGVVPQVRTTLSDSRSPLHHQAIFGKTAFRMR